MTIEMARPVLVEAALLGLGLGAAGSKPRMYREHLPQHPRRCSAARRHRHQRQLPYRISLLVPGAATVLLTPVWTDTSGDMEMVFMALVRDRAGLPLKLPAGGSQRLAALLQGAYTANWSRCQTWRADRNELTEFTSAQRDFEESLAAGYVESLAEYDARLNAKAGIQ